MRELVERLRAHQGSSYMCQDCYGNIMDEAADELERMAATINTMETTMNKSIRLQRAADLVGDLADAVEALGKQLDDLHTEIGEELFGRVAEAFPVDHSAFGPKANAKLVKLMHQLTPPDNYDPADARL